MDTLKVRQKLHEYIRDAEDEKVEAIYTLIKDQVNERYEWWNDEEMVAQLDKSEADFRSGKDPGVTWDALKTELLSRRKKNAKIKSIIERRILICM
jgi:hypothetical protein